MHNIRLKDVSFDGVFQDSLRGNLPRFSFKFEVGKTYLIDGTIDMGAWIISWLLSGTIAPNAGTIDIDGAEIEKEKLRQISWLVRYEEIHRFSFLKQSVKQQMLNGLKNQSSESMESIAKAFHLTPERYDRKLSQLSAEAWRASCAIGYANGRRLFCFPQMDYLRPTFILEYRQLWLEEMFEFLTSKGCIVIFPSVEPSEHYTLFDEVISLGS